MFAYLIRRIIALVPTLLGITLIGFLIINMAPGGPVEQRLQAMRFGGGESASASAVGQVGVPAEVVEELKRQYGFDKPIHVRYLLWLKNLSRLDFGRSFTFEEPALGVILDKVPVSIQFGVVSFILSYLICIPLGVFKAVKDGSKFDRVSSALIFMAYSVPSFMLAILLIVLLGGGSFVSWFPVIGVQSDDFNDLTLWGQFLDRAHHAILPLTCYMIGQITTLTVLMKTSMLEEIKKDYIRTARAKGLVERRVVFKHALRNALIPIATGFGSILTVFFTGSLLIETIFSINGMGLLSYQSILSRDYNVVMGLLVVQSLMYLVGNIISDFLYVAIDPRIDFSSSSKK